MEEPKFLADNMLGKVARWLVLMGYDAAYAGFTRKTDAELLEKAQKEDRVFLTRDAGIPEVKGLKKIVLRDQRFEDQLRQVLRELELKPQRSRFFSRCTYCNAALKAISRDAALPLVPPAVQKLKTNFHQCPACARVYWTGSHTEKTMQELVRMGI